MEKELIKVFQKAKYEENPNLANIIWNKIIIHNKNIARVKLWIFSFISMFSLAGLIPAWNRLSTDLTQSGIYEYLSLAFSNGNLIFIYWKEFAFSITESLPTISILLSLSLIFVLLLSIKYVVKQIITNKYMGETYKIA